MLHVSPTSSPPYNIRWSSSSSHAFTLVKSSDHFAWRDAPYQLTVALLSSHVLLQVHARLTWTEYCRMHIIKCELARTWVEMSLYVLDYRNWPPPRRRKAISHASQVLHPPITHRNYPFNEAVVSISVEKPQKFEK